MIKIEGDLLMFDKPSLNSFVFSKDCKINIPDIIPICNVDTTGESLATPIGHITSTTRSETGIAIEGVLINQYEDIYRAAIKESGIYFGGYFGSCESHEENGVDILTDARLLSVGLYMHDVYGDNSCKVYIVEEVNDND